MKIHPYWYGPSHLVIHRGLKPMDVNLILWRLGKALGIRLEDAIRPIFNEELKRALARK